MSKILLAIVLCVLLATGFLVGCSNQNETVDGGESNSSEGIQLGELNFQPIDEGSLNDDSIKSWFESNYKNEGISTKQHNENVYILLGAGEQKTGGYSVDITTVIGKEKEIVINGRLNSPKEGEMVIQALTYPNSIIRISKDDRSIVLGDFDKPVKNDKGEKLPPPIMESDGVYIGRADNNFIEIIFEGSPKEFMISESIKDYFDMNSDSYKGFEENDQIHFSYKEDKSTGHLIMVNIYKKEDINKGENAIIGRYIGQIDSNSVEIEINDEMGAYRLSEEAKTILQNGTIKEGDSVYIEYEKNEYDQLTILNIKKNPLN